MSKRTTSNNLPTTVTVDFHGDPIKVIRANETILVAMKPIPEKLELGWSKQLKLIKSDPVLGQVVVMKKSVIVSLAILLVALWFLPALAQAGSPDPELVKKFQPGKTWRGSQDIEFIGTAGKIGEQKISLTVYPDGKVDVQMSGARLESPSQISPKTATVPEKNITKAEGTFGIDGENRPMVSVTDGKRKYTFRLSEGKVVMDDYTVKSARSNKAFLK